MPSGNAYMKGAPQILIVIEILPSIYSLSFTQNVNDKREMHKMFKNAIVDIHDIKLLELQN